MATYTMSAVSIGYIRANNKDHHYSPSWGNDYLIAADKKSLGYYRLYFRIGDFPDNLKYYYLTDYDIRVCAKGDGAEISVVLSKDFTPSTLTYNTRPGFLAEVDSFVGTNALKNHTVSYLGSYGDAYFDYYVKTPLKYHAFYVAGEYNSSYLESAPYASTYLLDGSTRPYVKITYDDTRKNYLTPSYKSGPKSNAYSDPRKAITFQWVNSANFSFNNCYADSMPQASAVFKWKTSSASSWNEVSVSGNITSVTIPANTFPVASIIQWYVTITDDGGTTNSTGTFSFSTTASTTYAETVFPSGSIEANNEPLKFGWNITRADVFEASRVEIEWKASDSSDWITLADVQQQITTYTAVPGEVPQGDGTTGSFPVGEIDWRVRAYNVDGVAGPYSQTAYTSFGAPDAPIVDAVHVPFATILWQSEVQQAYELEVAGKQYGPYYGTEKSFTLPDYLEDGEYPAKVRIMGTFGVWSMWSELTLYIENIPGDAVTLTARAHTDADLSWTTPGETEDYFVYRNGVQIAHTASKAFTDRYSNGETEYYVINRLTDGNYSKSNVVERTIKVENPYIADVDGSEEITLVHRLKDSSDPSYTDALTVSYHQMSGNRYKSVSVSEHLDTAIGLSAVFLYTEKEEHRKFQKLLGKKVLVKLPDGWVGVCIIDSWQRNPIRHYYTSYAFTLQRIEWEDYVDDTQ